MKLICHNIYVYIAELKAISMKIKIILECVKVNVKMMKCEAFLKNSIHSYTREDL